MRSKAGVYLAARDFLVLNMYQMLLTMYKETVTDMNRDAKQIKCVDSQITKPAKSPKQRPLDKEDQV